MKEEKMKVGIKVLGKRESKVTRVYLAEIQDAGTSAEVLAEVFRGRQAVGNDNQTLIRCGDDKDFYGVVTKNDIAGWINRRLKQQPKL
jgi:hypothetical protein